MYLEVPRDSVARPRFAGAVDISNKWYQTEDRGKVNCEIIYGLPLNPPYTVSVNVLTVSGSGKRGITFDDGAVTFTYFEFDADTNRRHGQILIWRSSSWRGIAIPVVLGFQEFANLRVKVYDDKRFYYF